MDSIKKVKTRLNVVEVVGSYIDLKKSGKNYKAICPFHTEDTPSFMVSPKLGIYKCFGCGVSGDIFTFVQEMEGISFYEALQKLADKAGVELEDVPRDEAYKLKKRLYEINDVAAEFYQHLLLNHKSGKKGFAYFTKQRGLKKKTIKEFRLGYAPKTWDLLYKFLQKQGYAERELVKAGVIQPKKKGDGYIDKFRGRVVFPLIDTTNKVQGFMARTILDEVPKYLNTADTPIFTKSNFVYGLSQARVPIKKKGAVFVEGPMDVVSAFQHGIDNVVAPLGTSLTQGHLKKISRYTEDVTFCFDSDAAGLEAIKRAILIADKQDLNVKAAMIPDEYRDLDEVLKADVSLAKEVLSSSVSVYDFFIAYALKKYDQKSALGKKKIVSELSKIFSKVSNEVTVNHYVKELSDELDISEKAIYSVFSGDVSTAEVDSVFGTSSEENPVKVDTPIKDMESYFLFLLLKLENLLEMQPFLKKHSKDYFFSQKAQQLFAELKKTSESSKTKKLDIKAFIDTIDENLQAFVESLYLWQDHVDLEEIGLITELEEVSCRLEKRYYKKIIEKLRKELSLAEKQGDAVKVKDLTAKISKYSKKII